MINCPFLIINNYTKEETVNVNENVFDMDEFVPINLWTKKRKKGVDALNIYLTIILTLLLASSYVISPA